MTGLMHFDTPENVQVAYQPAGLGTRFLAHLIDQVMVTVIMVFTVVLLLVGAFSLASFRDLVKSWEFDPDTVDPQVLGSIIIAFIVLLMGLLNLVYYTLSELLMRGQTLGKRCCSLRVVKSNGFAIDTGSLLVRNLFRVLDQWPPVWAVPIFSRTSQRLGDMVAGTLVVVDEKPTLGAVRSELMGRKALEAEFRFDSKALERLTDSDVTAIEQLLERWKDIAPVERTKFADRLVTALATKCESDQPDQTLHRTFLEDLLAAKLRRETRRLN